MKINVLTTFRHGKVEFTKDEVRIVDDEVGAQFVANGWATDTAGGVAIASVSSPESTLEPTLDIQNVTTSQEVRHG